MAEFRDTAPLRSTLKTNSYYVPPKISYIMFKQKRKKNRKKKGRKEMTVIDDYEGTQIKRFSTITAPK